MSRWEQMVLEGMPEPPTHHIAEADVRVFVETVTYALHALFPDVRGL